MKSSEVTKIVICFFVQTNIVADSSSGSGFALEREVAGSKPVSAIPKTLEWHQWLPSLALSIIRQASGSALTPYLHNLLRTITN